MQYKLNIDPENIILFGDLVTFMALSYHGISYGIFFTNCYDVCDELNNDKYIIINRNSFDKYDIDFWNNVRKFMQNRVIRIRKPKPFQYQKDILNICKNYCENNNYDRFYMPCGIGK